MNTDLKTEVNLLHVEDNELDAKALQRAFNRIGITLPLARAKDGIEALEILDTLPQESQHAAQTVILLDINMPRMNGFEFLEELRRKPELRHTPVFILTTSDRPSDIREAYSHNIAGYIVKPVSSGNFVEKIKKWTEYLSVIELPKTACHSA